jgi:eukaryotic-like serine/threonine-protein kinase
MDGSAAWLASEHRPGKSSRWAQISKPTRTTLMKGVPARMPTPPRDTQLPSVAAADNPKDRKTAAKIGMSGARLSIGALVGPYRIDELIGSGGMGIVYRARDTRLERNVAIKVIPARISSPVLETALLREAQLTSSLSHPGIVTIYDILFHGGSTCIVMEFVQGQQLQQLIPEGGLAIDRALSMATLIGNAIAAAHTAGVVHRDLKPANILVRDDGQIRILDFGLAKVSRPFSPDAETQAMSIFGGLTVGTLGYMAPEQARGEDVDERADIFSFGVIFYQLLTGRLPFRGINAVALLQAMQMGEPDPMRDARPEIPAPLETVTRRALAKKAADRYQTIREMLTDLNAASGSSKFASAPAAAADAHTIAVLPLINISPDPENEYICDGLSEELINGLTQITGLRVVSRSSSFQCKGTTPDVREIGRRLGASLLVQGSLRRSGSSLRLTMQLSQTSEGYQIWSQRFDSQLTDLFVLQDELTAAVLEKLRAQLGARFPGLEAGRKTPSSEAYDLYLQGRFAFNQETPEEFKRALDLFLRAAAADPTFAPALIGIAETHMRLDWYGLEAAPEAVPAVRSALTSALRLQPDSVAGLCGLAITQAGWDWDWTAAGHTFNRAIAAGAGLASVHFHYGLDFLTPRGRLEEALRELRQALRLDPLSPIVHTAVGGCLYRMRRWEEAAETLRATLYANPDFGHAHWSLGRVLLEQGCFDEALTSFQHAQQVMGEIPAGLAEIGYCHARMGHRDVALTTLHRLQQLRQEGWVSPLNSALVHVGLEDNDAAMSCLEESYENRVRQLVWINVDPRYDALHGMPAFEQLIARLGLAPHRMKAVGAEQTTGPIPTE